MSYRHSNAAQSTHRALPLHSGCQAGCACSRDTRQWCGPRSSHAADDDVLEGGASTSPASLSDMSSGGGYMGQPMPILSQAQPTRSARKIIDYRNAPHHPHCTTSLSRLAVLLACTLCCTLMMVAFTLAMLPSLDVTPFPALAIVHTRARSKVTQETERRGHPGAPPPPDTVVSTDLLMRMADLEPDAAYTPSLRRSFPAWFSNDSTYQDSSSSLDTEQAVRDILVMLRQLSHARRVGYGSSRMGRRQGPAPQKQLPKGSF